LQFPVGAPAHCVKMPEIDHFFKIIA
jgi:hypothetical protein